MAKRSIDYIRERLNQTTITVSEVLTAFNGYDDFDVLTAEKFDEVIAWIDTHDDSACDGRHE